VTGRSATLLEDCRFPAVVYIILGGALVGAGEIRATRLDWMTISFTSVMSASAVVTARGLRRSRRPSARPQQAGS